MSSRLYRAFLWLLPPRFRRDFGARMAAAFDDALADAKRRGPRAAVAARLGAWIDLVATLVSVWRDTLRGRRVPAGGTRSASAATGVASDIAARPDPQSVPYVEPSHLSPPDRAPMTTFLQDAKYTLRSLRSAPGFTAVSVLTLALGIGAVTSIFSVVNAVLLRPLPYDQPDELVLLWSRNPAQGQERYFVAPMNFNDWRHQNSAFEAMAGFWPTFGTLTAPGEDPERLRLHMVTGEFFPLLRQTPFLGRLFGPDDETPGATYYAVLSHSLWSNRFNGDRDIVGRAITINGSPVEVLGVTQPGFAFPDDAQVYTNVNWDIGTAQSRYARWMSVIGRLRPQVTLAEAQADMDVITARLAEEYPGPNQGWSSMMAPLHDVVVGDVGSALVVLLGATALILLIACANVANLTLSRAETRLREVAVRAALGAARGRIARQLLTESLMLALFGALLGMAATWAALRGLVALSPASLPRVDEIGIDATVLLFALASTLLTGVLFGLVPAMRLVGADMNEVLKEGTKGTASGEKLRLRAGFVVMEVALAVMLVIGAGLLIRSFGKLQAFDPGFNPQGILTLMLDLPPGAYADDAAVVQLYEGLEERLRALPDVQAVSMTSTLPMDESVDYYQTFVLPDREPPPPGELNQAYYRQVGYDFFRVMGVRLLAGRPFTAQDREDSPGVVIINQTLARQYWPDSDPIGEHIAGTANRFGPLGVMLKDDVEIVGVVEDMRYVGLRDNPQPSLYFPVRQAPFRRMTVLLRTDRDPASVAGSVRAAVAELDPGLPVTRVATMEQVMERALAQDRFSMLLLVLFGAAALALAAVGIYGVLSYSVEQRTRELGIRMALGAAGAEVRGLVLRQASVMIALGIAAGLAAALALSRVLESQLFGVSAHDPLTYAGVAALLTAIAFAASYLPARRATTVDPIEALRNE